MTACTGPFRGLSEQSTGRLEEKRKIGMNGRLQAVSTPRAVATSHQQSFGAVWSQSAPNQCKPKARSRRASAVRRSWEPRHRSREAAGFPLRRQAVGPGRPGPAPGAASCPSRIGEGRGAPQGMHRQANAVVEGKTAPRLSVTQWGAKPRCPKPQARATWPS